MIFSLTTKNVHLEAAASSVSTVSGPVPVPDLQPATVPSLQPVAFSMRDRISHDRYLLYPLGKFYGRPTSHV